jgi:hypothetical protein
MWWLEKVSIGSPMSISPASDKRYFRRVLPSPLARISAKREAVGIASRATAHSRLPCSQ